MNNRAPLTKQKAEEKPTTSLKYSPEGKNALGNSRGKAEGRVHLALSLRAESHISPHPESAIIINDKQKESGEDFSS